MVGTVNDPQLQNDAVKARENPQPEILDFLTKAAVENGNFAHLVEVLTKFRKCQSIWEADVGFNFEGLMKVLRDRLNGVFHLSIDKTKRSEWA
jgi:hypothetical protein